MAHGSSETAHGAHHDQAPREFPLDIPSSPFDRYEHRRLTARDVMVHRIMAEYMNCRTRGYPAQAETFPDIILLSKLVFASDSNWLPLPTLPSLNTAARLCPITTDHVLDLMMRYYLEVDDCALRAWVEDTGYHVSLTSPRKQRQRASKEGSGSSGPGVPPSRPQLIRAGPRPRRLRDDEIVRLQGYVSQADTQHRYPLFDGGIFFPSVRRGLDQLDLGIHGAMRETHFLSTFTGTYPRTLNSMPVWPERQRVARLILQPRWRKRWEAICDLARWGKLGYVKDLTNNAGRGRNRDGHWSTGRRPAPPGGGTGGRYERGRRRCTSEPPPGSFASANLPKQDWDSEADLQIIYPRMRLSQIDKRSRRRSLSPTRIEEMFDWDINVPNLRARGPPSPGSKCQNCLGSGHKTIFCRSPCGHCGAISPASFDRLITISPYVAEYPTSVPGLHLSPHIATDCPIAPQNRCKCAPFPTYHKAEQCQVPCHRDCGNSYPPGHPRHRNAMVCKSRCCMCGIRGHSGRDCRNKTCRCGGRHLGQDCCWNPTCRVSGCDRYLCGVHCRGCGSTEKPFKERQCWRCCGAEGPFEWALGRQRKKKSGVEQAQAEGEEGDTLAGKTQAEGNDGDKTANKAVPAPSSQEQGTSKSSTPKLDNRSIFGGPRA